MLYDMTLVAYTPDGARLGNLPSPLEVNVGAPFDDVSSLTFTYPAEAPGVEMLTGPVEIAVEFMDPSNGAWFEPAGMRFLKLEWSSDLLEDVPVIKYTCPGYAWLLNKAVTQPPPASVKATNVAAATTKHVSAKAAHSAAQAALRAAMGLASGSVMLADYAPGVSNNGCWVLTDTTPLAHKGVVTGTGTNKVSSWVAMPGASAQARAVVGAKVELDAAQATFNNAKNNKSIARIFRQATPGTIVGTLLAEAHSRGRLTGITYTFGSGKDSAGKAWAKALGEYELAAGVPLFNVLDTLTAQGLCDWRMVGRVLEVYNPDTTLSVDRSGAVTLINGLDIDDAPDKGTLANVVGEMLFTGDGGMNFKLSNLSAPTPWGVWEGSTSQSGVDNEATGRTLGQAALVAGSAEQVESTRSLVLSGERALLPFIHYDVGDFITAPGPTGAMASMRVRQATVTRDVHGILSGSLVLNDRFIEKSIRAGKKMAGVFGGSASGGGGTITAPPPSHDTRTPAPAFDLDVVPDVYIDGNGEARGLVAASFQHDGTATTGTLMDIDRHQLYYSELDAYGFATGHWRSAGTTRWPGESIDGMGLLVSNGDGSPIKYSFHIRTTSANGIMSEPSNSVKVTMVNDTTPPPPPQFLAEDLTTARRVVTVRWQGKGMNGNSVVDMPLDFSQVNVYQSATDLGPWKKVGSMMASHELWQSDTMPAGKPIFYALSAVDRTGNESEMSIVRSITPTRNVDMTDFYDRMDAAQVQLTNADKLLLSSGIELGVKLADGVTQLADAKEAIDAVGSRVDVVGDALAGVDAKAAAASAAAGKAQTTAGAAQDAADAAMKRAKDAEKLLTNRLVNSEFEQDLDFWLQNPEGTWTTQHLGEPFGKIAIGTPTEGKGTKLWNVGNQPPGNYPEGVSHLALRDGTFKFSIVGLQGNGGRAFIRRFDGAAGTFLGEVSSDFVTTPDGLTNGEVRIDAKGNDVLTCGVEVPFTSKGAGMIFVEAALVDVTELAAVEAATKEAQDIANQAFSKAVEAAIAAGKAQTAADSKGRNWYQATKPAGTGHNVNDTWFQSPGNKVHRWSGADWVSIQDTDIAAAKTAATAADTAAKAADAKGVAAQKAADLVTADLVAANTKLTATAADVAKAKEDVLAADAKAATAQSLANGAVTISTSAPTVKAVMAGAIWRHVNADGSLIIGEYMAGSDLVFKVRKLDDAVLGNVNAATINAGTLNAARLNAADIRAKFISAGKIVATELAADSVTADQIKANSVTATAILGKTITAAEIKAGTLTSASGIFGTLDASVINAGTLNAARLDAGDIRAKFLSAGKITAADMVAGTITAQSGVIGSLDLGKATVGELDGIRIKAGTIQAGALVVGDFTNLASLASDADAWDYAAAPSGVSNTSYTSSTSGRALRFQGSAGISSIYGKKFTASPGESLYVEAIFRNDGGAAATGRLTLGLAYYDAANAIVGWDIYATYLDDVANHGARKTLSGVSKVPVGTAYARPIASGREATGTADPTTYAYLIDPIIRRMASGALIVDGSITGTHVDAESVAAKVGTFVEARVDKLRVTGTANIDTAVVNKLWTDVVRSRKITTDMMLVGQGANMLIDPNFLSSEACEMRKGNASDWRVHSDGTRGQYMRFYTPSTGAGSAYFNVTPVMNSAANAPDKTDWLPVTGGEVYGLTARIYQHPTADPRSRIYVNWEKSDGTTGSSMGPWVTGTGYQWLKLDWDVAEGTRWASIRIATEYVANPVATMVVNVYAEGTNVVRKTDASLIVDGGVLARHLTVTDEMWAKVINFKKIRGDQIAANSITSDEINVGSLRTALLTANAITATMIGASSITSKHTITGAKLQTVATANRGVKFTSTGIDAWNSRGVKMFELDAVTGLARLSGRVVTGESGGTILLPAEESFNGKQTGLFMDNAGAQVQSTSAGVWVSDINAKSGVGAHLNLRGGNDSQVTVWSQFRAGSRAHFGDTPSTGGAANAVLGTDPYGLMMRSTSSIRYKKEVQDWAPDMRALQLRPRSWADLNPINDAQARTRYVGFIAEEVAEIIPELVVYDDQGRPDALSYDRFAAAIIPVLQAHEARIASLEAALAAA